MKLSYNTFLKLIISILLVNLIIGCKKEKKPSHETPSSTTSTPSQTSFLTAKIVDKNGVSNPEFFSVGPTITKMAGTDFIFSSYNSQNAPSKFLELSFTYTTGIYTLTSNGYFSARFKDENNFFYGVKSGTLNITTFDTIGANQDLIKKIKATFSFQTDTVNNQYYKITNGILNYEK